MPEEALVLLVKSECHLCDDAREVLARIAPEFGLNYTELRLEDDPGLMARYAEDVPVLFVDGVQRDFWTIDPVRLRRLLTERNA